MSVRAPSVRQPRCGSSPRCSSRPARRTRDPHTSRASRTIKRALLRPPATPTTHFTRLPAFPAQLSQHVPPLPLHALDRAAHARVHNYTLSHAHRLRLRPSHRLNEESQLKAVATQLQSVLQLSQHIPQPHDHLHDRPRAPRDHQCHAHLAHRPRPAHLRTHTRRSHSCTAFHQPWHCLTHAIPHAIAHSHAPARPSSQPRASLPQTHRRTARARYPR